MKEIKTCDNYCYDCKHISKDVTESPCNECCEVYMGEDCKWEGLYCEDCKYSEVVIMLGTVIKIS